MNHLLTLTLLAIGIAGVTAATTATAAEQDPRCFEMRVYYAPPGKLDALNARFRDHTLRLFEKHGIANIGYWMPIDNKDNKLTYLLAYPSREARDKSWKAFQADPEPCVFLLSLRAAGTGLNLTTASYVILYDPWWNPAVEAQAIDRSHRIGQTRTVNAYRLIAAGTVEEKIWELQQRKSQQIADVLGEEGFANHLTKDDLNYLFQES